MTAISSNPTTILLKGNKAILNSINSIEIPDDVVSIQGAYEDVKAMIDVSEYIPEGISLVDPEAANVEILVSIGKLKEKVFSILSENIMVTGLATHHKLEFELSSMAVRISGLEEDIQALSSESLRGSIDVTHLPVGAHQIELLLDLDESKYSYLPVKVNVYITDASAPEGNVPNPNPDPSDDITQ